MQAELDALEKALGSPTKPVIAIIGGAKVSTKIDLLENLVSKVDALVIGGGMANTFLHAQGIPVGKSLAEKDLAALISEGKEKLASVPSAGAVAAAPAAGGAAAGGAAEEAKEEKKEEPKEESDDDMGFGLFD